ncbi:hypothetical protein ABND78_09430 [Paenibacillus larvae]
MKHAKSVQRSLLIQRFIIPLIYIMIPFILSYMNQEWATPLFCYFYWFGHSVGGILS